MTALSDEQSPATSDQQTAASPRKRKSARRSKQKRRKQKQSARRAADKQPTAKDFQTRRSVSQGLTLVDDAHGAVWRLYCDALRNWRSCRLKRCRRARCCVGEPARCLDRVLPTVTPVERLAAEREVIAGGPRRRPPSTHMEYVVRRQPLSALTTWRAPKATSG